MSPANIEATLKPRPADRPGLLHRRRPPYNTALITLDPDFAPVWAKKHGIEDTSLEALASGRAGPAPPSQ